MSCTYLWTSADTIKRENSQGQITSCVSSMHAVLGLMYTVQLYVQERDIERERQEFRSLSPSVSFSLAVKGAWAAYENMATF